jgi:hypothetical protein
LAGSQKDETISMKIRSRKGHQFIRVEIRGALDDKKRAISDLSETNSTPLRAEMSPAKQVGEKFAHFQGGMHQPIEQYIERVW